MTSSSTQTPDVRYLLPPNTTSPRYRFSCPFSHLPRAFGVRQPVHDPAPSVLAGLPQVLSADGSSARRPDRGGDGPRSPTGRLITPRANAPCHGAGASRPPSCLRRSSGAVEVTTSRLTNRGHQAEADQWYVPRVKLPSRTDVQSPYTLYSRYTNYLPS